MLNYKCMVDKKDKDKIPMPDEVRKYFAEMGRRSGNKLMRERGSQYFRDIASKRKRFGRLPKKDKEASK